MAGFSLPLVAAMGTPHKWKSAKFRREEPAPLKFNADGKFRILHITDIHDVEPVMDDDENREIPESRDKETINVIEKLVDKTSPDLVVFGGDNISGYWEEFTYGAGYFTYGKERGGRLIILDENEPENIYSESIEIERITTTEI